MLSFILNISINMDKNYEVILGLLQNALWKTKIDSVANCDWNEIDSIAQKHSIGSILASIEQESIIPKSIKEKWEVVAAYQIVRNQRLLADQDSTLKLLAGADIPVVILKGAAAMQYYSHPELRAMGDVDFIVPRDKYEETYNVLISNGFVLVHERSETERHIELQHNGFIYELHRFYTETNDSNYAQELDNLIFSNIEKKSIINIRGFSIPVLPHLINGLVLLQHINHHLERGLGLRQIIDWMMFYSNVIVSAEMWDAFHKYAVRTGLEQLEYYVTSMCIYYFGLNSPKDIYNAERDICHEVLQHIFLSGNFGQAIKTTDKQINVVLRRNRSPVQWIRMMCRNGNIHWKSEHKHALLPPFAFVYQIIYYVKSMKKQGISIRELGKLIHQHKKREDVLETIGAKIVSKGSAIYKDGKYEK